MIFDGTIRIQSGINARYLKELSQSVNYLKRQSGYKALSKTVCNLNKAISPLYTHSITEPFPNAGVSCQKSINNIYIQGSIEACRHLRFFVSNLGAVLQQWIYNVSIDFEKFKNLFEKCGSSRVMVGKKYPQPQCLC